MQHLDLTLPTAAENLALDEALLLEAEATVKETSEPRETLRLWESPTPLVVLGRSTPFAEVNVDACRERGIPILRRTSGGAAIVAGPGCLMYALVLSYELRPALRSIDRLHCWVLQAIASQLAPHGIPATVQGISDLTVGEKKFSGNSLRCKRRHVLYHGTLLYDFPLDLIGQCLAMPARQPDYRAQRPHSEFVTNLPVGRAALCSALVDAFTASEPHPSWPHAQTQQLAVEKYGSPEWNER